MLELKSNRLATTMCKLRFLRSNLKLHIQIHIELDFFSRLMLSIYLPHFDVNADLLDVYPYPILNNEFLGSVSHVEPPNIIYVMNNAHSGQLSRIFDLYDAFDAGEYRNSEHYFVFKLFSIS